MNLRFLNNFPSPSLSPLFSLSWRPQPSPNPSPSFPLSLISSLSAAFARSIHWLSNPLSLPPPPPRSPIPENPSDVQLFRPYVAKVPWHGGPRAFLSQLFPRYGHYCGPNWSSGKDGGLPLWDRRPIDWLDFCCYCHDIGYDTHDQRMLLQADLAFLQCLERPRMATKGDARAAHLYKTMCIAGLRNILIPYRLQLVRMQTGPSILELMSSLILKRKSCDQDSGNAM